MGLQITYRSDQLQPCAHSPLGVVFMSLRVAEVDQDAYFATKPPKRCTVSATHF